MRETDDHTTSGYKLPAHAGTWENLRGHALALPAPKKVKVATGHPRGRYCQQLHRPKRTVMVA